MGLCWERGHWGAGVLRYSGSFFLHEAHVSEASRSIAEDETLPSRGVQLATFDCPVVVIIRVGAASWPPVLSPMHTGRSAGL